MVQLKVMGAIPQTFLQGSPRALIADVASETEMIRPILEATILQGIGNVLVDLGLEMLDICINEPGTFKLEGLNRSWSVIVLRQAMPSLGPR